MSNSGDAISNSILFREYKKKVFGTKDFLRKEWEGKVVVLPTMKRKFRLLEASSISKLEYDSDDGKKLEAYVVNSPVWELDE
ncbi:hypothetical protein [Brazilian marseillevirus]|uniref:hypothetical protein n=1 Tax=Brazilian marseillevirus TaxID=1813599 RepID=UPI000783D975|nr:hypothetical protein A3303_gp201 [Brazilian marseillevirus]AMQ10709.1 hypothetical protein [Brazilian marseillevirus]